MCKKHLYKFLIILITTLTLSGCVIIVGQVTPEEKELSSIQQNIGTQVKDISQKVQSGNYSQSELATMIAQGEQSIQDGLSKINNLNLPEKAHKAAEKTKIYLESAQKIFGQLKALIDQFNQLKIKGEEFSNKAQQIAHEQVQQIENGINSFQSQLDQIGQQITEISK